eukprot:COSAG01_NODE_616_length_14815_cov_8.518076_14_plen_139_part_00
MAAACLLPDLLDLVHSTAHGTRGLLRHSIGTTIVHPNAGGMAAPAGAASPPGSVVYTRQRLPPPALFVDLERRGWVRYLSKTYTFAHGDAVDVGLVGKDEGYEKVSFAIIEEKGDVVVKPRRGATLSYNADDIFTIPR